jgi:acylphosphatase
MSARRFVHVTIRGDVQGVGFRAFVERQAVERGLDGWVRNRGDGAVEAVFAGPASAVDGMIQVCRQGPAGARVAGLDLREEDAAGLIPSSRSAGFYVLPTV